MTKQSAPTPGGSEQALNKTPGRTLGFSIMVVMIVFVAWWLQYQASLDQSDQNSNTRLTENLDGFRADVFFLPDAPMLGFVEIPAGTFTMGSNPALDRMAYQNERWSNLERQGEVSLPAFYIAQFETTAAQFNAFVRDTGVGTAATAGSPGGAYPITNVTWPEALAYGRWLQTQLLDSEQTPQALRTILENGGRVILPSEAEWEKAARSTDGRVFPWGARPQTAFANFNSEATLPVGSRSCVDCAYGLSDMAGNVWELTRSPLQDYPYDPAEETTLADGDPLYVMRGGSYSDSANNVRTAVRGAVDPGVRSDTIGFRLVITPQ